MALGAANESKGAEAGRGAGGAGGGGPLREWQTTWPMARNPAGGGAERSGGECATEQERRGGAMDRVSSSMRQAANPLPRVLSRRAGGGGLEAERESFERAQVRARRPRRVVPPRGAGTRAGAGPAGGRGCAGWAGVWKVGGASHCGRGLRMGAVGPGVLE